MSDINFLPNENKGGASAEKSSKESKQAIKWSKPSQNKVAEDKKESSGRFSFLKKIFKDELTKGLKQKNRNKDKLKHSRQEVLKLIEEYAKQEDNDKKFEESALAGEPVIKNQKEIMSKDKTENNAKEKIDRGSIRQLENEPQRPKKVDKPPASAMPDSAKIITDKQKQWESSNILETNLIKGEITFFFDWRKGVIRLLAAVMLAFLLIGFIYGGLIFWQRHKEAESRAIAEKFENLVKEIVIAERGIDDILVFQKKLKIVSTLFNNHIYWTNFFEFLEDHILVDSYLNGGFSGDTGGNYNFSIIGVNYNTIYQQLKIFKKSDQVISAEVTSGSFSPADSSGQSRVNFNLELSIKPEVFHQ